MVLIFRPFCERTISLACLAAHSGQTSGDLEAIDGATGSDFIGERGAEILHRPETLDEVVHHIDIEQRKNPQRHDLPGIGLSRVNA